MPYPLKTINPELANSSTFALGESNGHVKTLQEILATARNAKGEPYLKEPSGVMDEKTAGALNALIYDKQGLLERVKTGFGMLRGAGVDSEALKIVNQTARELNRANGISMSEPENTVNGGASIKDLQAALDNSAGENFTSAFNNVPNTKTPDGRGGGMSV